MDTETVEPVEVEVEELSLRESLESAIEEHDPDHELIAADPEVKVEAAPAEPAPVEPTTAVAPEVAAPTAAPASPVVDLAQAPSTTELKAPAQWKPNVREKWNALPRDVQEEVLRRESDNMRLIGSVGPKIRAADELAQHMAPFVDRLNEAGVPPAAFVGDMFNSVKILSSGSAQERAEVVANIVQSYGVDLPTLDAILTKRIQTPPEVFEARQMAARAQAVLQNQSNNVAHQDALEAEKAIAAFAADPKHEFIVDVRDLMADLIESGRAKTLDDAYSAAIWANADTRKILLQREAQSRATSKTTRAATARKASSSVRGSPSIPGAASGATADVSLREALSAAFDEHSSL